MPNLSEILDSIVTLRGISSTEGFHQHVYKTLDVRRLQKPATVNAHLINPLNDELGGYSSRAIPLTGKEEVYGDHPSSDTEITFLFYHETLEDLEAVILNDAGIFNPFTMEIDAIVQGLCREYTVFFKDEGNSVKFDKKKQCEGGYANGDYWDLSPFADRQIQWQGDRT